MNKHYAMADSNILNDNALQNYLEKSTSHYIILNDYIAMEAYKGNTLVSISHSIKILSQFPSQVIILKGTQTLCGYSGTINYLKDAFIDKELTKEFDLFCKHLNLAEAGNEKIKIEILKHGTVANEHMDKMLKDAEDMMDTFKGISTNYSVAELKIIRKNEVYTERIIDQIIHDINKMTLDMYRNHPNTSQLPPLEFIPNLLVFRIAVAAYLMALKWISRSTPQKVNHNNIRNDMVDCIIAAYATYYDSLLSKDIELNNLYHEVKIFISRCCSQ